MLHMVIGIIFAQVLSWVYPQEPELTCASNLERFSQALTCNNGRLISQFHDRTLALTLIWFLCYTEHIKTKPQEVMEQFQQKLLQNFVSRKVQVSWSPFLNIFFVLFVMLRQFTYLLLFEIWLKVQVLKNYMSLIFSHCFKERSHHTTISPNLMCRAVLAMIMWVIHLSLRLLVS